ncbi:hypothetical protein GCM10011418_00290 [Sphingobacterium alkalisoli]|nr:hypothetical protein GCM10011418_00290 [Sphingobacterium alkalisoli]
MKGHQRYKIEMLPYKFLISYRWAKIPLSPFSSFFAGYIWGLTDTQGFEGPHLRTATGPISNIFNQRLTISY